ncbi:Tetraketide alpha-pyrone reductase 1 [Morella rubra]|uniref:Tetraketide alpha-pyrone reductase 1 n=1 Tax=Morella rubra TaxID=262757 RepID=A0A6A1WHV5_9ROSI|nr:Tetraketide alpha-pyrone reductase 1 [Morella rubra]
MDDPKKTEHLLALDGAKERLQLFKADLLEEGCFDPIVEGCQGVFHTASPVYLVPGNPQSEIIDPAVKGTLNVLRSCAKVPSIKRVVITASMASVMCHGKPLTTEVVFDETWFSDTVRCEELKNWYALSKTLAEESAWKFSEDHGIDLVTICPGFCIGPLIQPAPTFSIEAFLKLVKDDPKKTEHLLALDGAKERLQLFKADLLEEGCFDPIVEGCQGVFHTASPVYLVPGNPQSEIIDPAVKGTLNVLRSCAKVPSIKRVVITASMASVMCHGKPLTTEVVFDETWFSDTVRCEELKNWYALSKTLAEESAWKFSEDHGIDLVTICPGFCIGPLIQPAPTFSIEAFLKLVKGTEIFPDGIYIFVDIRDVVDAHILAFETPTASGRYCVVGRVVHYFEAFKILQKICPSLHLPEKFEDDKPSLPVYKVSQDRARSLGINFIPLEVSLRDTVESLKEKGFLIF